MLKLERKRITQNHPQKTYEKTEYFSNAANPFSGKISTGYFLYALPYKLKNSGTSVIFSKPELFIRKKPIEKSHP